MPAVALIKLVQGLSMPPAGEALSGVPAVAVDVSNATAGINIGSWQIDLVYVPPGSTVLIATLAFSNTPSAPFASFTPDAVPGSYRLVLSVWNNPGRVGRPTSKDIRIFAVPEPANGFIFPPYQELPPKLPVLGSGLPGEKPDEANFGGQPYGWDGIGTDGLILHFLRVLAGGGAPNFSYKVIFVDTTVTIPAGQQMLLSGGITIDGSLTIDGELVFI